MCYADSEEMAKLDKLAVERGLSIRQMMELAGWHMLGVFTDLKISKKNKILIVCGKGNKGGDGLSCARHLSNFGYDVEIILMEKEISADANHHLKLLRYMNISINYYEQVKDQIEDRIQDADVFVDALIGYSLKGSPRGDYGDLIMKLNESGKKIISYDIPTGIEASTGRCNEPFVRAFSTLTLALPKKAFKEEKARVFTGKLFLGDIGIPGFLYDQILEASRPRFEAVMGLLEL